MADNLTPSQIAQWCQSLVPGDLVAIHRSDAEGVTGEFVAQGKVMHSRTLHVYVNRDGGSIMESLNFYFEKRTGWCRRGYCIRPIEANVPQ